MERAAGHGRRAGVRVVLREDQRAPPELLERASAPRDDTVERHRLVVGVELEGLPAGSVEEIGVVVRIEAGESERAAAERDRGGRSEGRGIPELKDTAIDGGAAGPAVCARQDERARPLLDDRTTPVNHVGVVGGSRAVEDERALVGQVVAEGARIAAVSDLERAAGRKIDGAARAAKERAPDDDRPRSAHRERAGAGAADGEIPTVGPRAPGDNRRTRAAEIIANRRRATVHGAAGEGERAGPSCRAEDEAIRGRPRAAVDAGTAVTHVLVADV